MEKELRKKQSILGISGAAVIAFGIWSIVKSLIVSLASENGFSESFGISQSMDPSERALSITVTIVLIVIDLGLRVLIGLSARAESKGKKKSAFYLVVAAILILYSLLGIVFLAVGLLSGSVLSGIVSIVVECTSLFALIEVIVSSVGVRRLRKKLD